MRKIENCSIEWEFNCNRSEEGAIKKCSRKMQENSFGKVEKFQKIDVFFVWEFVCNRFDITIIFDSIVIQLIKLLAYDTNLKEKLYIEFIMKDTSQ